MSQQSYKNNKASLYIIPTPIGNLEDITLRAINILKEVKVIFCEDTRNSKKLLDKYNIKTKTISLYKDVEETKSNKVLKYLEKNFSVALISDGGTPLISDPGHITVSRAIEKGYNIISLPGPTALIPALTSSGIESNRFTFFGFLSVNKSKRKKELEQIKNNIYTSIIYESPHRIKNTLSDILKEMKERKITVAREISKINEEIYRNIDEIISREIILPKGELVIIIEGTRNKEKNEINNEEAIKLVELRQKEGLTESESIKEVSKHYNISKNLLYNLYIKERK